MVGLTNRQTCPNNLTITMTIQLTLQPPTNQNSTFKMEKAEEAKSQLEKTNKVLTINAYRSNPLLALKHSTPTSNLNEKVRVVDWHLSEWAERVCLLVFWRQQPRVSEDASFFIHTLGRAKARVRPLAPVQLIHSWIYVFSGKRLGFVVDQWLAKIKDTP